MNTQIKNLLTKHFPHVLYGLRLSCKHHDIYCPIRSKLYGQSYASYDGNFVCGQITYILSYFLQKEKLDIKIYKSGFGYGAYKEDHVYLKIANSDIIIDPTYKQWLRDSRQNRTTKYHEEVYVNNPPFYVGFKAELFAWYNEMLNKNIFPYPINTVDDINDFYKDQYDISWKMTLYENIHNANSLSDIELNKEKGILQYLYNNFS